MTTLLGMIIISCFFVSLINVFAGIIWLKQYTFAKYQLAIGLVGVVTFSMNMLTWQLR